MSCLIITDPRKIIYSVVKYRKRIYRVIIYMTRKITKSKQQWTRYTAHTKYEITCTFEDEWQGLKSTQCQNELQRLINFKKFIQCTYLDLLKHCTFELYTELSDPQVVEKYKVARLHLHGVITLGDWDDVLKFKLNTLSNIGRYGRVQINEYREEWDKYMSKDQDVYSKWLPKYESMSLKWKKVKTKSDVKQKDVDDFFKCV